MIVARGADGAVVDGTSRVELEGSIDGVGDGAIVFEGTWIQRGRTQLGEVEIVDADGAFEGAEGGMETTSDATTGVGTWVMTLTLPADRFDDDFVEVPAPEDGIAELTASDAAADLPAGSYRTDLLGMRVWFDLPDTMRALTTEPGRVALSTDGTGDPEEGLILSRVGSWYGPDESADPNHTGLGSIDADAIDAWIVSNDIVLDDVFTVTVDGRSADVRTITIPADRPNTFDEIGSTTSNDTPGCRWETWTPCLWADSDSARTTNPDERPFWVMSTGSTQRLWLVDLGDQEPLLVRAFTTTTDGDAATAWLDGTARDVVRSIMIGTPTPVDVSDDG